PTVQGFINGYQTMDLLAALCFGIVIGRVHSVVVHSACKAAEE
ncbi:branched-chain amino acid transport system II carrier protein, partial [Adlercreutzia sp.]